VIILKINKIKINAFGRLEDKEIELSENLNIVYGNNESGKSTLLKFITNTFYGTSKNKKGKNISDFELYKPWNKEEFSGKISYELSNGKEYEVFREFSKKTPKIYNENNEEISKQFGIDKNTGSQFFYEQTNIDEDTFTSTFVSMQQEVKLDTQSQNVLIQKIANIAGTGDDNVSYKKAIEKLSKKQSEEIGTSRTLGKPINIVSQNLNRLKNEKQELSNYKDMKYEFEDKKNK
jgi:predicted ATP-dependent endonuclease of OLD family